MPHLFYPTRISMAEEKTISIAVQQGQRRRIMKGMAYDTEEKHGYIYLVRTREFKSLNRPIYKVGRTSQCPDTRINRLHKYTKGSEIYLVLQCHVDDVGLIEKDILEAFCHRWDPGPDGSEDFIIPTASEQLEAKQIIIRVLQEYEQKRIA
jgi:T5orf172 domain